MRIPQLLRCLVATATVASMQPSAAFAADFDPAAAAAAMTAAQGQVPSSQAPTVQPAAPTTQATAPAVPTKRFVDGAVVKVYRQPNSWNRQFYPLKDGRPSGAAEDHLKELKACATTGSWIATFKVNDAKLALKDLIREGVRDSDRVCLEVSFLLPQQETGSTAIQVPIFVPNWQDYVRESIGFNRVLGGRDDQMPNVAFLAYAASISVEGRQITRDDDETGIIDLWRDGGTTRSVEGWVNLEANKTPYTVTVSVAIDVIGPTLDFGSAPFSRALNKLAGAEIDIKRPKDNVIRKAPPGSMMRIEEAPEIRSDVAPTVGTSAVAAVAPANAGPTSVSIRAPAAASPSQEVASVPVSLQPSADRQAAPNRQLAELSRAAVASASTTPVPAPVDTLGDQVQERLAALYEACPAKASIESAQEHLGLKRTGKPSKDLLAKLTAATDPNGKVRMDFGAHLVASANITTHDALAGFTNQTLACLEAEDTQRVAEVVGYALSQHIGHIRDDEEAIQRCPAAATYWSSGRAGNAPVDNVPVGCAAEWTAASGVSGVVVVGDWRTNSVGKIGRAISLNRISLPSGKVEDVRDRTAYQSGRVWEVAL